MSCLAPRLVHPISLLTSNPCFLTSFHHCVAVCHTILSISVRSRVSRATIDLLKREKMIFVRWKILLLSLFTFLLLLHFLCSFYAVGILSLAAENGLNTAQYTDSQNSFRTQPKTLFQHTAYYDVCVIGAGLSGTVFAERYATILKKKVLVIDIRDHVGGNCYDFVDQETGILMNKYGAHLFHTNSEKAWRYINMHHQAPAWVRWDHKVVGIVKGKQVPIPVNIETVNTLFQLNIETEQEMEQWLSEVQIPCPSEDSCGDAEKMAKSRVGNDLFELIFRDYTKKQWNKEPRELDQLVTARIPVRNNFDPRYFSDKYQVLPSEGYTKFFEALLYKNPLIDVFLQVDYFSMKEEMDAKCGMQIYTGPIDKYFQHQTDQSPTFSQKPLDSLEYRSIRFITERYYDIQGYKQPNSVVNYPGKEYDFTRIVEYKHFLHQQSRHTVTVKEVSTSEGDPYYPVPNKRNLQLYEAYRKMAEEEEATRNVYFVGRLANYKYFNMDAAIINALDMFYKIAGRPQMPDVRLSFVLPSVLLHLSFAFLFR